jgi:membrane associated rhomboid family serine protease
MIPLRDVIPSRTTPGVTLAIIALQALVFVVELATPAPARDTLLATFGLVPAAFQWSHVLTSLWFHASWAHIAGNLLCLWIFGDNVENRFGHGRFLTFYVGAGVLATLVQAWVVPHATLPLVGASGAIAGVMGAYVVLFPTSRVQVLIWLVFFIDIVEVPAVYFLAFWLLLQVLGDLGSIGASVSVGGVALWTDLGGFLTGAAAAKLVAHRNRRPVGW